MEYLVMLELICIACVLLTLVSLFAEKRKSESIRRIRLLSGLSFVWLVGDMLTYYYNNPATNYFLSEATIDIIYLLVYVMSNVVLIGFLYYCEAYLNEKTTLSKWTFVVPILVMVINIGIDIAYYVTDRLVINENGYYKVIGTPPMFVLVSYVVCLFYVPLIAFIKRKEIGNKSVYIFASYCIPITVSIIILALSGFDYSVATGSITVVIVARILQNDLNEMRLAESYTFMDYFLGTYVSAYYVDMNNMTCKVYKRSDEWERDYQITQNYYDALKKHINVDVHPEDRDKLIELINPERMKSMLATSPEFSHLFRDISGGVEKTYRLQVIRGVDDSHAAFGFIDISSEILEQNRRMKESEESKKLIESVALSYNMAYCVNLKDDTFRVLRMDSDMVGADESFDYFSECIDYFIGKIVHETEKERMAKELDYDYIRNRLKEEKTYDVEYRALINGVNLWDVMNITYIDEDEIGVGFAHRDVELIRNHLEEKRYNEYMALFVVDIDTGLIKNVVNNSEFPMGKVGDCYPYKETLLRFADLLQEEPQAFFMRLADIEYVKEDLSVDDKRTYTYKAPSLGKDKWVDLTSYVILRHEDNTPAMFTFGFSIVDNLATAEREFRQKLVEDMQMIGGLASEYYTLYYFNIDNDVFKIYSLDGEKYPETDQIVKNGTKPIDMLRYFCSSELIYEEDRALFAELDVQTIREKLANTKKYTIRFRRKFDEEYRWCEMDMVKYEKPNDIANAICIGFAERDAQIRNEIEQQSKLENAVMEAESANKSKTDFLFNMSHDIRTPMNAITGFTMMAKKYLDDKERVADYLNKIDISGKQLLTLINQVLEMSRIESGKMEFEYKPVNIYDRFSSMVVVLNEQAKVNGQEFTYSLDNITHGNVLADDARMESITLNIAGNAMKYTPEGGKIGFRLEEIPCEREGYGRYAFTVSDTGIGMSEEYLKKLFEPFSREKNTTLSKIQGTGLGMAIVKKIVDQLGGSIEVQSEKNKGTTLVVTVDFELDGEQADNIKEAEIEEVSFEGRRILVTEDNEMNREIAKDILEEYGFVVEEADDGTVAVEKVKDIVERGDAGYYDLILMDVQMPLMGGYEATEEIRRITESKGIHIPIIAMTANAYEEDRQNAIAAGMDEHIAKPIVLPKLLETMAKFVK